MRINVLEYLDRAARQWPDKAAFCDAEEQLSFAALDAYSRAIGTALAADGHAAEPVVVYLPKSPKTVAAFFGVLRAGCYYVPLDDEMPRLRVELIIQTLAPRAILCNSKTRAAVESLDYSGAILDVDALCATPVDNAALAAIRAEAIDTDPIYVVFTSGSTGKPKGVVACHRSVIDYVEQLSARLAFDGDTVFGNQAPLYVDACLKELYPTLKFGATTCFVPKGLFSFPVKLLEYLNDKGVNTICWVASALTLVAGFGTLESITPTHLRTIAFGSEVFPPKQLNAWRRACPNARFFNLYGPTEATGMSCAYEVTRDFAEGESVPIGRAFPNTQILLLDEHNARVTEAGVTGEICIRGTALTLGYYSDPERTDAAFVQNPLQSHYPEKLYRTGDLGQTNAAGELCFLSRKDYQIKHMGHRIELGEIEGAAHTLPGMRSVCCVFDDVRKKIVLFYAADVDKAALIAHLKTKLPRYMLPNAIHPRDELPLTPNGKLDRAALKASLA
ncbi:MAG: amino acid adenylation domain-containing protein [Oscillospiraceae bacterium]|jgi:amino acid adenylation domain-containing protein|nr:amino acid adenylation domain-containing protein [Oscillospiraceae bacterium]